MTDDDLNHKPEETRKLSDTFSEETIPNQIEDLEDFEEENFVEADFRDIETEPAKRPQNFHKIDDDAIVGEPITDPFDLFVQTITANEQVTILIVRLPDRNLNGQFRVPCITRKKCESIYWNGESDSEEIYSHVARTYGGGNYQFQIRKGTGFGTLWSQVIADPPTLSEYEKTLRTNEKTNESEKTNTHEISQSFAAQKGDSIDDLIEHEEKMNKLRSLFIKSQPQPQPTEQNAESLKDRIMLKILDNADAKNDKTLFEKIAKSVYKFGDEKETKQEGFADVAFHLVSNPKETVDMIGGIASALAPLLDNLFSKKKDSTTSADMPVSDRNLQPQDSGLERWRKQPKENAATSEATAETSSSEPENEFEPFNFIALKD